MLLVVVGDVEPEEVVSIAREVLGNERREVAVKHQDWPEEMTCETGETICSMEVAMPMFNLAFKSEPLGNGEASIRQEMVADLAAEALFGESSELYLKLYEEELIDSSFGGGFETTDGCALLICSGDSNDPYAVRDAILTQAERIAREGIPEEEFLRMKRSALGRRIRASSRMAHRGLYIHSDIWYIRSRVPRRVSRCSSRFRSVITSEPTVATWCVVARKRPTVCKNRHSRSI